MESTFSNQSSGFSDNKLDNGGVNFNIAKPLKTGGSTCDTYVTRANGRLIFVKRLKEEYRNKPIYLNAIQKEFEVGGMLRHKSLPVYLEYHEDYICLDFVDGQTLSDMIANYNPWLINKENIKRLIEELLDVVAYLHDKNVIHCDIKADNILLTYGTHNLFLIDLDKCYTSWFDNTSGSSEKYGLRENAKKNPSLDFRGIGRLLEYLEDHLPGFPSQDFQIFKDECFSNDVTLENLKYLLKNCDKSKEEEYYKPKFRKNKLIKKDATIITPRELQLLERERQHIYDTLIISDGPLKYNILKTTNEVSVECREDARNVCFEVNIVNPYQINGINYHITTLPIKAFAECINLKSIILPQGIDTLYRATFMDCLSLEYVKIPESVKIIMGGVFSGCRNLKKLEFENPKGVSIVGDFIYGCQDSVEIVDLSTGISYSYVDFIQKFGKKD